MTTKILIIDDDVELCGLLEDYLVPEGFSIKSVHRGDQGLELANSAHYHLVILDVMLPEINGFDVLRELRFTSNIPVLMLTAKGGDVDKIVGLEMGADDYLPKPFNPRELVARIRTILRRTKSSPKNTDDKLVVDDIVMDCNSRTVFKDNNRVQLTDAEFRILELFLRSAGQVVLREEITRLVLGRTLNPYDRSVDVHISNLRKKIGNKFDGHERIQSIRGVGYLYTFSSNTE